MLTVNVYIIVIYDMITVDYCKCILLYSPLNSYLYVHWILLYILLLLISILCHTYKLYERLILNRITPTVESHLNKGQAGFRPGKSCTSQFLNLTQHIKDGYQNRMITGAAFVNLSAGCGTFNHRILIHKIFNTTRDSPLCRVIQNMLSGRRFYVELNNERSRWRKQKNRLPQASVLSPVLFNIYTNDSLKQHCLRAAYQAGYVWGQALKPYVDLPSPS